VSSGNAGFFHSDSTPVRYATIRKSDGTLPILVKKFKPSNLLDLAALGLAPFTGGASALAMGGVRAAQAAKTAGKVGVAGQKVGQAQAAKKTAMSVPQRSATAETQSKLFQDMSNAGENRAEMAQLRSRAANPVPEVPKQLELEASQHNAKRLQGINETTEAAAEAEKNMQELQSQQKEKTQAAGAGALVGVQSTSQAGQTNSQKQQAEMERIERIAEDGRAKANTGAKVAVA